MTGKEGHPLTDHLPLQAQENLTIDTNMLTQKSDRDFYDQIGLIIEENKDNIKDQSHFKMKNVIKAIQKTEVQTNII